MRAIMLFHRDLRVVDNTALNYALNNNFEIIPLFIFTPQQIDQNKFKSDNSVQFMIESLKELDKEIDGKLCILHGDTIKMLDSIKNVTHLFYNRDYTPFALKRDHEIDNFCKNKGIEVKSFHDSLLLDTLEIKTGSDTYYKTFTSFYNKSKTMPIRKPKKIKLAKIINLSKKQYPKFIINDDIAVHGGRSNGLKLLKKKYTSYPKTHNLPSIPTTMLSAHNKFGTVSIREVYYSLKYIKDLSRQLYWRDFYCYIGYHFPEMYDDAFLTRKIKTIGWEFNKSYFDAWKNGRTGFPLVDAGMRQMNKTGFMHNRVRLVVAMFLTKDLLIDWKKGERYFSTKLVDIDRAQNTGNWNWSASFGLDHAPYPRVFNPWTQSKRFDPDCIYIKKWIPELRNCTPSEIHSWDKYHDGRYLKPIIDHHEAYLKFKIFYKKYFSKKN